MGARASAADMLASATVALQRALTATGARATSRDGAVRAVLPNGHEVTLPVVGLAIVDEARAHGLAARVAPGTVVVADLIGARARAIFTDAGVGWLDRRGHLRVVGDALWIDLDVEALPRTTTRSGGVGPIRGAAAIGVASAHLIDPERFGAVRSLAAELGLSPAAVSTARSDLRRQGLLGADDDSRRALFLTLSAAWRPTWIDLASVPDGDERLVVAGTLGAAALGAPIIASGAYPLELYCTERGFVERVQFRSPSVDERAPVAARIALAPTSLVAAAGSPVGAQVQGFAVTHPLFVALDLAADQGRGLEALTAWTPLGWPRAW